MTSADLSVLQPYCENNMQLLRRYRGQFLCGLMNHWREQIMMISFQSQA